MDGSQRTDKNPKTFLHFYPGKAGFPKIDAMRKEYRLHTAASSQIVIFEDGDKETGLLFFKKVSTILWLPVAISKEEDEQ